MVPHKLFVQIVSNTTEFRLMQNFQETYNVPFDFFALPPADAFVQSGLEAGVAKKGLIASVMHFFPLEMFPLLDKRGFRARANDLSRYECRNLLRLYWAQFVRNDPNAPKSFGEFMDNHVVMGNIDGFITPHKGQGKPVNLKKSSSSSSSSSGVKLTNQEQIQAWITCSERFFTRQMQVLSSLCVLHDIPVLAVLLAGTGTRGERLRRYQRCMSNLAPALTSVVSLAGNTLHPCRLLSSKARKKPTEAEVARSVLY